MQFLSIKIYEIEGVLLDIIYLTIQMELKLNYVECEIIGRALIQLRPAFLASYSASSA